MLVKRYELCCNFAADSALNTIDSSAIPNTLFEAMKDYNIILESPVVYTTTIIDPNNKLENNVED